MGFGFSMINYDTIANGLQGSMNLMWNQAVMHSSVYPSLFMYPTMNFGCFSPYQFNLNNNWLLNPGFALNNTFNQFGMQNPFMFNSGYNTNPWACNFGFTGSSSSTAKTDEELDAEKKNKELNNVISELVSAKILDENDKKKINAAFKNSKDAGNDIVGQYEAAKAKFDELISGKEAEVKRELLEKGDQLKLEDGTKILVARKNLGIGDDLTALGMNVEEIQNAVTADNIIEYVEEFQKQHGKKIFDKINSSTNQSAKEKSLNKLASTLMNKARAIKSKLDDNSKQALQSAIDNLENIGIVTSNDTSCSIPSGFKTAFETLYAMTRIAEATYLDSQISDKYGKYSEAFNKEVFKNAVKEDLSDDGYSTEFSLVVDKSFLSEKDSEDLSSEEVKANKEQEEAINKNNKDLDKALKGLELFGRETAIVNIDGKEVSLTKLVPTDIYGKVDSKAKTYYYNPVTGKYTEADSSGKYSSTAKAIDIEEFKKTFEKWTLTGENCLYKLMYNSSGKKQNIFKDKKEDGFDIFDAYNSTACYKRVVKDVEEEDKGKINSDTNVGIKTLIETIAQNLKQDTPLEESVIDNAKNRMDAYYDEVTAKLVAEEKDNCTDSYEEYITDSQADGRISKERKLFLHIGDDDNHTDKAGKGTWDPKIDSGITIRFDDDGHNSWDVYISTHVLVKKFEYFLSLELQNARS